MVKLAGFSSFIVININSAALGLFSSKFRLIVPPSKLKSDKLWPIP